MKPSNLLNYAAYTATAAIGIGLIGIWGILIVSTLPTPYKDYLMKKEEKRIEKLVGCGYSYVPVNNKTIATRGKVTIYFNNDAFGRGMLQKIEISSPNHISIGSWPGPGLGDVDALFRDDCGEGLVAKIIESYQ